MEKKFEIEAKAEALGPFRNALQNLLEDTGFDAEASGQILVAVQEALTNIIRHAYKGEKGAIQISLNDEPDRIEIAIRDFGKGFDPKQIPPPELPPKKPGGLGLYLIRSLMDQVEYQTRPDHGNLLRLVKHKKPETPRPHPIK